MFQKIDRDHQMNTQRIFIVLGLMLLLACKSAALPLPQSEKLSPAKVKEIAARIDHRHGDLSSEMRRRILETVVRSIDNMVFIEGGEFEMGDFGIPCEYDPSDMCEWPCGLAPEEMCPITMFRDDDHLHKVRLSSFYLSRYHTTLRDFDLFRTAHGKELFDKELRKREDLKERFDPNKPAHTKEWREVKDYCLWLGELSGYPVDLPTEAQWEYAARNRGKYVWYPTDNGNLEFGRNYPPRQRNMNSKVFPVGSFAPNPLGLYDMVGNVKEWVNDWYEEKYYQVSPVENPMGPNNGIKKVMRGTPYFEEPWMTAHAVLRRDEEPVREDYYPTSGFRCAIQMDRPLKD
jgi:formylglycine-generating enzyme required for sulfatase activity